MTFALPGVKEREADSDGVCEQLSHLRQAMGYVAGLSKLTVRNALPPSLPPSRWLCRLPFLSSLCLFPPSFFHAPFLSTFFPGPLTVSSTSSLTLSASCCLSQLLTFIFLPPSAPASFSFQCGSLRSEQVGLAAGWQWICVVFVNVLYTPLRRGLLKPSGCFRYMHTLHWIHAHAALYGHKLFALFSLGWSARDGMRGDGVKEI